MCILCNPETLKDKWYLEHEAVWSDCFREYYEANPDKVLQKEYKYFITFTTKPDIAANWPTVQKAHQAFINRKGLCFTKLWYVEENHDTNPHIHNYVVTSKPMRKQAISYHSKGGHIDYQRAKGTDEEIKDYLGKTNPIVYHIN